MNANRDQSIVAAKGSIVAEKVEQERALAQKMLFDAKRENVKLQLEAAYREQLVNVYSEVLYILSSWNLSMSSNNLFFL